MLADWQFGSVLWAMVVFFFWFMAIWIFIALFADIFRRRDLSGGGKAGWTFLLFILPFLGAVIYLIARPKGLPEDEVAMGYSAPASSYSAADEVAKLAKLRDEGAISAQEFEQAKAAALARA